MFFKKTPLPKWIEYIWEHYECVWGEIRECYIFWDVNSDKSICLSQRDDWSIYVFTERFDRKNILTKEKAIENGIKLHEWYKNANIDIINKLKWNLK